MSVLESDYSTALTLLLRYPTPKPPHISAGFVSDAIYLREHLDPIGGAYIISKYSKRAPSFASPRSSPTSPSRGIREAGSRIRAVSPLSAPVKYIQAQGGLDRLVSDVTKGVLDTGERWGVNKAVREVMGEVKRNVEGFQQIDAGRSSGSSAESKEDIREARPKKRAERNQALGRMLDKSLEELGQAIGEEVELKLALSRIQHVKECILDAAKAPDEITFLTPPKSTTVPLSPPLPSTPDTVSEHPNITSPFQNFPQNPPPLPPLPISPLPPLAAHKPSSTDPATAHKDTRPPSQPLPPPSPPPKAGKKASKASHIHLNTTGTSLQDRFPAISFTQNPAAEHISSTYTHKARVSLARSEFAWMLGEDPLGARNKDVLSSSGSGGGTPSERGGLFGNEGGGGGGLFGDGDDNGDGIRRRGGQKGPLFGGE